MAKVYFIFDGNFSGCTAEFVRRKRKKVTLKLQGMFNAVVKDDQIIEVKKLVSKAIEFTANKQPHDGKIVWVNNQQVGIQARLGRYKIDIDNTNLLEVAKDLMGVISGVNFFIFNGDYKGYAGHAMQILLDEVLLVVEIDHDTKRQVPTTKTNVIEVNQLINTNIIFTDNDLITQVVKVVDVKNDTVQIEKRDGSTVWTHTRFTNLTRMAKAKRMGGK